MELAHKNAALILTQDSEKLRKEEERTAGAMEQICGWLGISGVTRIESYDISNINGFQSVGSMVVFENGETENVLSHQLENGLKSVEDITKVVIAYEPVWAIGTGKTATDEQAQETIKFIRKKLGKLFGVKNANRVVIQYGGSMNAKNCKGLMAQPDIDGGLIGGASLKTDFAIIVNYNK